MEKFSSELSTEEAPSPNFSLYALACVLTDDPARAEILVRNTLAGGTMSFSADWRVESRDVSRQFARRLYERFCSDEDLAPAIHLGSDTRVADGILESVRKLPEGQRVLFALCTFGGHTFRQAAEVLDMAAEEAAEQLDEALHVLDVSA